MMTCERVWAALVVKRPLLADEAATVSITSRNLKHLLDQVYAAGRRDGLAARDAELAGVASLFDRVFGKGR